MEKNKLLYLVKRFREQTITDDELRALKEYVQKHHMSDELLGQVFDELALLDSSFKDPTLEVSERMFSNISQSFDFIKENKTSSKNNHIRYWVASAAVLFVVGIFTYLYFYLNSDDSVNQVVLNDEAEVIKPGSSKAILLLDDGTSIDLENLSTDSILQFNGYSVAKNKDGQLSYILSDNQPLSPIYNTIITPKGGEYKLSLPDETQIWVNASSKVRYPLHFAESSREVELEGEAYFDVKKKVIGTDKLPFIVYSRNQTLEVLGTEFNVNTYSDNIQTTLVEGLVKLSYEGLDTYYLKPSEQANYSTENNTVHIDTVDPFYTIAWKNDKFAFENASIFQVMEAIARWYDVEVIYEGDLSSVFFSGTISKYEDFNKMLNIIEWTGPVKFDVQGRRVVVMK